MAGAYPRVRILFWADKLRENVERAGRQSGLLASAGWWVLRFWEHEFTGGARRRGILGDFFQPRRGDHAFALAHTSRGGRHRRRTGAI